MSKQSKSRPISITFLRYSDANGPQGRLFSSCFSMACFTSMRIGDICGLGTYADWGQADSACW